MRPDEKIEIFREKGVPNEKIAEYFSLKLKEKGASESQIETWLDAKGITLPSGHVYKPGVAERLSQEVSSLKEGKTWAPYFSPTGSIVGARLGSTLGPAGTVAGTFIGGALAKPIEWAVTGFPETPQKAAQEMTDAGTYPALGEGVGALAGRVMAPMRGRMGPLAQKIATIARERKMPLPASAIVPSKMAGLFEWFGRALPSGRAIMEHQRNRIGKALQGMMEEIVGKIPIRADKYMAGGQLVQALKTSKQQLKNSATAKYKLWEKALGTGEMNMANTASVLAKEKDTIKNPTIKALIEQYARRGSTWTPEDVDLFQKQIWSKTYKKMPHLGGKLTEALKKDLGDETFAALKTARDEWAQFQKLQSNQTVKNIIRKYNVAPENVMVVAFRTGNFDDVMAIKKAVDKNTWDVARNRFVENIIDTAVTEGNKFQPKTFIKNYEKYGRMIDRVMPEISENMNDFYQICKQSLPYLEKMQPLTGMAKVGMDTLTYGGGAGIALQPWLAVPYGFSAAIAKSITKPQGLLKQGWLKGFLTSGTEGMMPAIMQQAPRMGGRVVQIGGKQND